MKNRMRKQGESNYRLFTILLWAFLLVVVGRVGWLQLVCRSSMEEEVKSQFTNRIPAKNPRGKIVDRNGEVLAVSLLGGSLYVDNVQMRKDIATRGRSLQEMQQAIVEKLGPVIGLEPEEFYQCFAEKDRYYVWAKRMLSPEQARLARQIIKDEDFIGVSLVPESIRYYPKATVAAQVLGFVGIDDDGLGGIEYVRNSLLKGDEGTFYKITNVFDREIIQQTDEEIHRKLPTIYLTLDSKIQYVLETAMDDAMKRTKALGAAAVIMNPYTGEILGMVSRPTFDPNNYDLYPEANRSNQCISTSYEPGSVFKPIVGCMGMIEGLITPHTIIDDEGRIAVADRVIHNWDDEGRGKIPFSDVIKYSINTGMVKLGLELGANQMINYSKRFGFGEPTNIELPGEAGGILYEAINMYQPDIATMAIGQGIAVTPLQMLRAICAIANGGELVQPYIIDKIVAADGSIVEQGGKQVVRKVMEPQIAAQMRSMMEQVVAGGGGKTAAIKGYRIAGKTGTAQKSINGSYVDGQYMSSFVGFVPSDEPQYAMLVMLDTPKGLFYGSQVSAPVFRDTLQQILVAKGIQPMQDEGLLSFSGLEVDVQQQRAQAEGQLPKMEILPNGNVRLPSFTGCDMRETAGLLVQGNLKLQPYGSGRAYKQEPAPSTLVEKNTVVKVWFK